MGLIEAVYLVHENYGLLTVALHPVGFLHDLLYFLNAARHGRESDKLRLRSLGYDLRKGSLAYAGRSPEYHRRYLIALDKPS